MPTYEYKCEECGIVFERFQHFSEDPLKTCPECTGMVRRVIKPVGIIFKGKGFYVTDNKANTASLMPRAEPKGEHVETGRNEAKEAASEATPKAESKPTESAKSTKSAEGPKSAKSGE